MLGTGAQANVKRNRIGEVTAQVMRESPRHCLFLAEVNADVSRQLVPVQSGALRASIRAEERPNGAATVAGGESAPYAPVVELGGANSPAQPFLRPGAESAIKGSGRRFRFNVR